MFDSLTERLTSTLRNLRGAGRLTEENIKDTMREVRMALLEADVALPVVREFVDHVRERAVGQEVTQSLTPGQVLVKNLYLSLDPYMRGRMNEGASYAENVKIGQVMVCATVGEVLESKNPAFKAGLNTQYSSGLTAPCTTVSPRP